MNNDDPFRDWMVRRIAHVDGLAAGISPATLLRADETRFILARYRLIHDRHPPHCEANDWHVRGAAQDDPCRKAASQCHRDRRAAEAGEGRWAVSSDTTKVNVYSCQACEHDFVTVDRDEGVTPMFMTCRVCGGRMVSAMYRCDQTRIPTHEWFRPSRAQIKGYPKHERDHFRKGGLDIREIAP